MERDLEFEDLCVSLDRDGFFVDPAFLEADCTDALVEDALRRKKGGTFRRAGVGKLSRHQLAETVRLDEICWFDEGDLSPAQLRLTERLEQLRASMNRSLMLGLWDFESHYAAYPAGGFYRRHVDRFSNDDARTISVVIYLNRDWQSNDGGELLIYDRPDAKVPIKVVAPRAGTLVCFLSDRIEHEVTESRVDRLSIATWFRKRTIGV